MEPTQSQAPTQSPIAPQPQVIIADPKIVPNVPGAKKNFLLPVVIIVIFLIIGVAVFIFKDKIFKSSVSSTQFPQDVSCTTGFEGNAGNNFCSNYHGGSSLCRPGFEGNYPDGCTK
ncbi:hypothetical protein HYT74_00595 [Candidatus Daviesbacteria bacterium]|nr:hypothetical protein [Candidatus Daviesbacteria bacterium]